MTSLTLSLRIKPNSRRSGPPRRLTLPDGTEALELAVNAPPIDGKANAAVIERLAELLDVPKSAFSLTHGTSSKLKRVKLEADQATCNRIKDWIAALPL